ncbi:transcription factor, STE-like protein, partial [Kickxella alabastrina]|uniref:transcription factor, STE-like protein n=1 Tax=Kickxella alabastrina TaxID=61397 RepID=UPI002220DB97
GDKLSCIRWDSRFHITSTDIIRALVHRFQDIHRPVVNMKKFEEGVFSDLRSLKPGVAARLEPPRSEFLELLYKQHCVRTQKKQKVFYWELVPHDMLFREALERDLKREAMGARPTTKTA